MNRSRPFSKWGAYTESDNAPARNRVWPCETTSSHDFVASALLAVGPYALLVNGILTVMKSYRHTCIH